MTSQHWNSSQTGWLCHKHSDNVVRHDETPVKSTTLSHEMDIISRVSDISLWPMHLEVQYAHF